MSREKIPQTDVLAWLLEHHPELHAEAEIDREWVWLCVDLRGDHNKPTRESIKGYGFRFCKKGHAFPSGKAGTWAHSCERPTGFKRRSNGTPNKTTERADPIASLSSEEMAMLS